MIQDVLSFSSCLTCTLPRLGRHRRRAFCDDVLALPLTVDRGKTDFLVRKAQCLYSNVPYCTQSSEQTSIHASFNAYSELNPEGSPFFRAVAADGLFARVFFFFFLKGSSYFLTARRSPGLGLLFPGREL